MTYVSALRNSVAAPTRTLGVTKMQDKPALNKTLQPGPSGLKWTCWVARVDSAHPCP